MNDGIPATIPVAPTASDMRAALQIPADCPTVLALPPILPATNTDIAAWAFMLVQKVLPNAIFLLPDAGRDVDRVVRFFLDTGHADTLVLFDAALLSNTALLDVPDALLFLPSSGVGIDDTIGLKHCAKPLLLSDLPALRRTFRDHPDCHWCRPHDPKDAARLLLPILER